MVKTLPLTIISSAAIPFPLNFVARCKRAMVQIMNLSAMTPQPDCHMRNLKATPAIAALLASLAMPGAALAQEREWMLDAADEDAFLVFGVPETDDVGVSLWCKIGSGRVKIFFPDGSPDLKPDTIADFTMTVAGKPHALKGTTTANAMTGATSVESEFPLDDAVITELGSADRFSVKIGTHESTYPLVDAGLENLIKLCRSK
jgi:hypothetical protein